MEYLKRNEIGQFHDDRISDIEASIDDALGSIYNKYNNICGYDIEFIIHSRASWLASMKVLKDGVNSSK